MAVLTTDLSNVSDLLNVGKLAENQRSNGGSPGAFYRTEPNPVPYVRFSTGTHILQTFYNAVLDP